MQLFVVRRPEEGEEREEEEEEEEEEEGETEITFVWNKCVWQHLFQMAALPSFLSQSKV